jgi:pimeloyl-ACP methyl ester carboxylesterase
VSPLPASELPPVVLAHGVGSSHEHAWVGPGWTDVLAEDGRTVVPFELPGHGAAPPLAGGALEPPGDTGERLAEALEGPAEPADPQARVFWRPGRVDQFRVELRGFRWDVPQGRRGAQPGFGYLRHRVSRLSADELAAVTAAVLLVLGDRDFAAPGAGPAAALPDARLVPLRGADHFGAASDVRAMEAVTAFLAAGG